MSDQKAKLVGVGVGPGDPELITVKGVKAIQSADVIVYHETDSHNSNALKIASRWISPSAILQPLTYPVTVQSDSNSDDYKEKLNDFYKKSEQLIETFLKNGKFVVVLAEGDPLFYSSFMYIYDRLGKSYKTEIIAGISSVFGAASVLQVPLCYRNQSFTVLSGVLEKQQLIERLKNGDAFAILKVGRNVEKIRQALSETGLIERALYIERATMENQKIIPLKEVDSEQAPYFSLILIPGQPHQKKG